MIVVDTCAVLWTAQVPQMLSNRARIAIAEARGKGAIAISDKTLWELAMMAERGQFHVHTTLRDFLETVERYFDVLPITSAIAERSMRFSSRFPKDPTDRLIAGTALEHGFKLVTADKLIRKSGEVPCIW